MVELMTEGPPIVGILGPTLSQELTVVGQIVPFYDVVQVLLSALFGAKARGNWDKFRRSTTLFGFVVLYLVQKQWRSKAKTPVTRGGKTM